MYKRYHIETQDAPPLAPQPNKFAVKINKLQFFQMVFEGISFSLHSRLPIMDAIRGTFKSRPCIYGVYDSPVGGLMAKPELCRGCLRCMIEHPKVASIEINPRYSKLGNDYWNAEQVLRIWGEALDGKVPVKGAGYGGLFKGHGFDGIWTDMSEIVRPTRDGIHGREFISTVVDIGRKPMNLSFGEDGNINSDCGNFFQIPIPFVFESYSAKTIGKEVQEIIIEAALKSGTLCILPVEESFVQYEKLVRKNVVPISSKMVNAKGEMIELTVDGITLHTNKKDEIKNDFPIVAVRLPFSPGIEQKVLELVREGFGVFHLYADENGREFNSNNPKFVTDLIRTVHLALVKEKVRDQATIIVGGGIIAAEHLPKAILCGADLVAITDPLLVALQGEPASNGTVNLPLLDFSDPEIKKWGVQRLLNLAGAWHSQLLEILGAMGIREVRRLRGETGRAIFADEIEKEVFGQIFGKRKSS